MQHWTDEQLQHACNLISEHGMDKASKILEVKSSTLERYHRESRIRGISAEQKGEVEPIGPRIFVYDVENAPTMAGVWGLWNQNVNHGAINDEWFMLSWSGKWLFDTEIYSDVLTPEEAIEGSDKRIMQSLWAFLDMADIVVGHNIVKFDNKKVNTRFIVNDINPPSPFRSIDTLSAARKHFSFSSNRLDYLCKQLDLNRKADKGGIERWMGCISGNPQDLINMEKYNRKDISISEELYLAIRPYMTTGHPNMGLFFDSEVDLCRICGSHDLTWLYKKFHFTGVNKYPVYECNHCGGHGRSRFSAMTADERRHITTSITR